MQSAPANMARRKKGFSFRSSKVTDVTAVMHEINLELTNISSAPMVSTGDRCFTNSILEHANLLNERKKPNV